MGNEKEARPADCGAPVEAVVICLAFFILISLGGCKIKIGETGERPNPAGYVCDKQQLELVAREVEICDGTGYMSDYCFAVAKSTQCTKIAENEEPR